MNTKPARIILIAILAIATIGTIACNPYSAYTRENMQMGEYIDKRYPDDTFTFPQRNNYIYSLGNSVLFRHLPFLLAERRTGELNFVLREGS